MTRPELTFDGKGINGPDQYRTRVATFNPLLSDADVTRYGKLFAASPALLESAKLTCSPEMITLLSTCTPGSVIADMLGAVIMQAAYAVALARDGWALPPPERSLADSFDPPPDWVPKKW